MPTTRFVPQAYNVGETAIVQLVGMGGAVPIARFTGEFAAQDAGALAYLLNLSVDAWVDSREGAERL